MINLIPKKYENDHPNKYNTTVVNKWGALRLETYNTAPNKRNYANSPAKPTPLPMVGPTTSPLSMTPKKRPTPFILTPKPAS